jgi:hypothetical protein
MRKRIVLTLFTALLLTATMCAQVAHQQPVPIDMSNHDGWTSLFDGKTLSGWSGDAKVWRVEDGAIVGQFDPPPNTRNGQTFLILNERQPGDFELTLDVKIEGTGADSGIQFRSYPTTPAPGATGPQDPKYYVGGYQYDLDFIDNYTGQVAEGSPLGRGIIATRGQVVHTETGKPPELTAELGTPESLGGYFKINGWNHLHLIARGHVLIQILNGHVMAILVDDAPQAKDKGIIALQCGGRGQVKLSFRDLWLKEYKN